MSKVGSVVFTLRDDPAQPVAIVASAMSCRSDLAMADEAASELKIRCSAGHRWVERWPMPMTMAAFGRRMKAVAQCPTCEAPTFLGWPDGGASKPATDTP